MKDLVKALALHMGDLRDWPAECPWCGSQNINNWILAHRDMSCCVDCGAEVTNDAVHERRLAIAEAEVWGTPPPELWGTS